MNENNNFINNNNSNYLQNECKNFYNKKIKNKPNQNISTEYKSKNEYGENNNLIFSKIQDFREIIIRFKLNSEEYKLLLKEKAKLINPFN